MNSPVQATPADRARELWTRIGWLCVVGLFALQVLWQSLWPPAGFPPLLAMVLALLPLLPLALAMIFRLRHQLIYAGIGVLIYFCHGVMECYANPPRRPLAVIEIVLSVTYFAALYMRRRVGGRASN